MSRLVDYFVIVGYDHKNERGNKTNCGVILQRFPENDWSDTPFIDGIEWFCQPQGWFLLQRNSKPKFFTSVLTDIDAERHFCACLCFYEAIEISESKKADEYEDTVEANYTSMPVVTCVGSANDNIRYSPKCLVLVSRQDFIDTFKNCLGIIYSVYIENMPIQLETLVGNLLGCVQVPSPGGPQVRFSIGAGDRQALQPPLSTLIPVTQTSVYLLLHLLGVRNVIELYCGVMTEHRILFHSTSYNRITQACRALVALMYPFKYTHVYIPLLPAGLLEVLSTPTPFIMGVHSSLRGEIGHLVDVIVADLDGGSVSVPDAITLFLLPDTLYRKTQDGLLALVQPDLQCADDAFTAGTNQPSQVVMLDKEIRAVFMRIAATLLQGYRRCLKLIRINPKPVVTFHKAQFLAMSTYGSGKADEFTTRLLDCMYFNGFIAERGQPWRLCDVWDELYNDLGDILKREDMDMELAAKHIRDLAQKLYINENPNPHLYQQQILVPTEGAFMRIHQMCFPQVNVAKVQQIIDEGTNQKNKTFGLTSLKPALPRIVPLGPNIPNVERNERFLNNSVRRLEVLKQCINYIFDVRISDAKKTFPAVLRALQFHQVRLALCQELLQHVDGAIVVLEHQQFDLVVRLMNCALQTNSQSDEYGVAAKLVPFATIFCRKLCNGVSQFAYTSIQEHSLWTNQQFWEMAFYQDVENDIKLLYTNDTVINMNHGRTGAHSSSITSNHHMADAIVNMEQYQQPPSALEICAQQMRSYEKLDTNKKKELSTCEENTIYSQAINYANRMVYLLIPLDIGNRVRKKWVDHLNHNHNNNNNNLQQHSSSPQQQQQQSHNHGHETSGSMSHIVVGSGGGGGSVTNSIIESDNYSTCGESEFGGTGAEQDSIEIELSVTRLVARFIDKVCTEGGVTADHVRNLHQMLPGIVHMHIENLDAVYRESKRLPSRLRTHFAPPDTLPDEDLIMDGIRAFLLADGRDDCVSSSALLSSYSTFLPAEGAIFVTNYRIIFKGKPCDAYVCEKPVMRTIPIGSITKEKKLPVQYLPQMDQWMQESIQLRSCTFQMLNLGFDDQATPEDVERFKRFVAKVCHAHNAPHPAFHPTNSLSNKDLSALEVHEDKHTTLKSFAKKTLLLTKRKAGIKNKLTSKRQHYVLANNQDIFDKSNKYLSLPSNVKRLDEALGKGAAASTAADQDATPEDERRIKNASSSSNDALQHLKGSSKATNNVMEVGYVCDWNRLNVIRYKESINLKIINFLTLMPTLDKCDACNHSKHTTDNNNHHLVKHFRLSLTNADYTMCQSYPAFIVLPTAVSDESVRKVSRCYRQNRVPLVTWRHPRTLALLLRGAGLHSKSFILSFLKTHHGGGIGGSGGAGGTTIGGGSTLYDKRTTNVAGKPMFLDPYMTHDSFGHRMMVNLDDATDATSRSNSVSAFALENEKYLSVIAACTPSGARSALFKDMLIVDGSPGRRMRHSRIFSAEDDFAPLMLPHDNGNCYPDNGRTQAVPNDSTKSFWSRTSKSSNPSNRWNSLKDRYQTSGVSSSTARPTSHIQTPQNPITSQHHHQPPPLPPPPHSVSASSQSAVADEASNILQKLYNARLFILGEKRHIKGVKVDLSLPRTEFIPVEFCDSRETKAAFKKMMKSCVPGSLPNASSDVNYYKAIEETEWLKQIQSLMQLSGVVVDLLDLHGASVSICLEEGWDCTAQLSSVAQICLDSYYRTISGFRTLIEKDWLGFGHRFNHCTSMNGGGLPFYGYSATFLQFLDIVHQVRNQFPWAFEFNDYYLRFIAYHTVSCRFQTFLCNCEFEQVQAKAFGVVNAVHLGGGGVGGSGISNSVGQVNELSSSGGHQKSSMDGRSEYTSSSSACSGGKGSKSPDNDDAATAASNFACASCKCRQNRDPMHNVFDYVERVHFKSSIFFNYFYMPDMDNCVLRPMHYLPCLDVWQYYNLDNLKFGTMYDIEVTDLGVHQDHHQNATGLSNEHCAKPLRSNAVYGYNVADNVLSNAFAILLEQVHCLENELGYPVTPWKNLWDNLEGGSRDGVTSPRSSFHPPMDGNTAHIKSVHTRSTLEMLLRGKAVNWADASMMYAHSHRFEVYNFSKPTSCDGCTHLLWGPVKTGVKCTDCGINCHEKCIENIPRNCTKDKHTTSVQDNIQLSVPTNSTDDVSALDAFTHQHYDQYSSNVAENRTHEGYLYKRGALLKSWKQRWFVLDSMKHQLRYYDSMDDSICKGFIDLSEVVTIVSTSPQHTFKKMEDKSFFELRTIRRTYNFCATSPELAREWIERLQSCLQ